MTLVFGFDTEPRYLFFQLLSHILIEKLAQKPPINWEMSMMLDF